MSDELEPKPPQNTHLSTGVFGHVLESHAITTETGGPLNGFNMKSEPMLKMCHSCGKLHRDIREGATAQDASLCPQCEQLGIAEPARYTADGRE